jgi:hypothetical protein
MSKLSYLLVSFLFLSVSSQNSTAQTEFDDSFGESDQVDAMAVPPAAPPVILPCFNDPPTIANCATCATGNGCRACCSRYGRGTGAPGTPGYNTAFSTCFAAAACPAVAPPIPGVLLPGTSSGAGGTAPGPGTGPL